MPLFISKDCHYSIFSPGPRLSLSGGNLVHRTWCPRGARKDDGWCLYKQALMNSTEILYTPFPTPNSVKHYQTFLKHRIYHLFSELTECLRFYFVCSAYLDWVIKILFHLRRSLNSTKYWSCTGAIMQVTLEQSISSPWTDIITSPGFVSCMHSSRMWFYSEIIDKNTSSYITILMCPCSGENCAPEFCHFGITQLTNSWIGTNSFSKFRLKRALGRSISSQNKNSLWHAKIDRPFRWK